MSLFSRRHYLFLADQFARTYNIASHNGESDASPKEVTRAIVHNLAYSLKCDNPKFDQDRFLTAILGNQK